MTEGDPVPYHDDVERLRRDFQWHLTFWSMALEQQRARVLTPPADGWNGQAKARLEVDLYLSTFALRQFLRAAEKVAELDPEHEPALAEFKSAVPDMVLIRDVLTHYDEYEKGGGKLQPNAGEPYGKRRGPFRFDPTVWNAGTTVVLTLGDSDVELDLTAAWEASERFFLAVHPVSRWLDSLEDEPEEEPAGWGADDLHACLRALAVDRPLFHHEADFQHALAWRLHLDHPAAHLRLETRPLPGRTIFLDIAARFGDRRVAIELKYLARRLDVTVKGEPFALQNQAAQLIRRYDAVKDIARLEEVIAARAADVGFAVVLSNEAGYWKPGRSTDSADAAFRLDQGRVLTGSLAWSATAGAGTMRNREDAITLRGSYPLSWRDYSTVTPGPAGAFRYLLIEVPSGPSTCSE